MRLSEAIRLGAMLKPQAFGTLYEGEGTTESTCALGAAVDALGKLHAEEPPVAFFACLADERLCICPECGEFGFDLGSTITHLNDKHRWTRERCADYVATVEPAEAPLAIERAPDEAYAWVQTTSAPRAD